MTEHWIETDRKCIDCRWCIYGTEFHPMGRCASPGLDEDEFMMLTNDARAEGGPCEGGMLFHSKGDETMFVSMNGKPMGRLASWTIALLVIVPWVVGAAMLLNALFEGIWRVFQ